jgi:hypothetical protein
VRHPAWWRALSPSLLLPAPAAAAAASSLPPRSTTTRSHHAGKVRTASAPECPTSPCSALSALSRVPPCPFSAVHPCASLSLQELCRRCGATMRKRADRTHVCQACNSKLCRPPPPQSTAPASPSPATFPEEIPLLPPRPPSEPAVPLSPPAYSHRADKVSSPAPTGSHQLESGEVLPSHLCHALLTVLVLFHPVHSLFVLSGSALLAVPLGRRHSVMAPWAATATTSSTEHLR